MKRSRLGYAASAILLAGLTAPASGLAATAVGQTPPVGSTFAADCNANSAHTTRTATGVTNPYIATASGVITEWQFQADVTGNPGSLVMQTLNADPNNTFTFTPVAESATETPVPAQLNRFKTRTPISAGQFVGLRTLTASHGCYHLVSSGNFTNFSAMPAPLPGSGPTMYGTATGNAATNVAATIEADGDGDGFGDETQDGCPSNAARSDDCVKPEVTIDKGPPKKTRKGKATFVFSSNEAGANFECSVDGKPFSSCSAPFRVKRLKPKRHTFAVRAVDANANKSTEANYRWKVKKKRRR